MSNHTDLSKAPIIKAPFIDWILEGRKTCELRSTHTQVRSPIALIQKGMGTVVAVARLLDFGGPLSAADMAANSLLNRSANGRPPGRSRRYAVHCLRPGPCALPLSPG